MDERIKAYETKMSKSYDSLLKDFSTIRAGRANPHVLDVPDFHQHLIILYFRNRHFLKYNFSWFCHYLL